MSGRYKDYKGSSRSARDDSRPHKERNRSRSPRRTPPPPSRSRTASSPSPSPPRPPRYDSRDRLQQRSRQDDSNKRTDWESSEEEVPPPPPPPRISKISMGFSKPGAAPIKMNLGGTVKAPPKKPMVASVFNDDDDEPEEMPAEAKMRMRNIGRETPTSAGPNSFGKTKHGFCDSKKVFEKNLKIAFEMVDKKGNSKFPQTIYKISDGTK